LDSFDANFRRPWGTGKYVVLVPLSIRSCQVCRRQPFEELEVGGATQRRFLGGSRHMLPGPVQLGRVTTKTAMTQEEEGELRAELLRLQQEHRDLDAAIAALQASPGADVIQVQRLKKRKLQLRDRITFIEDQLTPDIIA
jgi:hypothetical protein